MFKKFYENRFGSYLRSSAYLATNSGTKWQIEQRPSLIYNNNDNEINGTGVHAALEARKNNVVDRLLSIYRFGVHIFANNGK